MSATLLALALGLMTALCFGTGDFLAARLTHSHGWLVTVFAVQIVAGLMLAGAALVWWPLPGPLGSRVWLELALLGVANTLAVVALYRAFASGKVSIISPIAGSMGAFTLAFAWLAGLPPEPEHTPGVIAMLVGVALASVAVDESERAAGKPRRAAKLRRAGGVGWALVSACGFGWVFFRLGSSSAALGPAWAVCGLRAVALLMLMPLARAMRQPLRAPLTTLTRASAPLLLLVAACDSGGMLTFAYASSLEPLRTKIALLTVIASCFPVLTILWARARLRESLAWWQWIGVGLVIASIAWISKWSEAG